MPARMEDYIVGQTTTTAGSSSNLVSSTPPNGINSFVEVRILARCPTTGDRADWYRSGYVNKTAGGGINLGVVTLLPNLIGGGIQRSAALLLTTANIQVNVTATAVTVVVTGAAGRTMNWVGHVEVTGVEP